MKIYSIFKKNLKMVSRNWSYMAILIICPIILILVSGIMLKSSDFGNIKIGLVDEDPGYNLNFQNLENLNNYDSLSSCIYELTYSRVSACIHIKNIDGAHHVSIYLDNARRIVEFYAKQFILENLLSERMVIMDQASSTISSKLIVYSNSMSEAKNELIQVRADLDEQERNLTNYKNDLAQIRADFEQAYWPIKNMEPELKTTKENILKNRENLRNNISYFRTRKQSINTQITALENFLSGKLNQPDYDYVYSVLNPIVSDLENIDRVLGDIENNQQDAQMLVLIENVEKIIPKLDAIKLKLESLDADLQRSIDKTRQSKKRVDEFIVKLDDTSKEISGFSENLEGNKVTTEFQNAFSIKYDPVLFSFPLLVAIIITFSSLVLSNKFILNQVGQPSYFRDIITPTWDITFLVADYLINLFFIGIQAGVLFLIGLYWFSLPVNLIYPCLVAIFLTASLFIFIGMIFGYIVKSQSLSTLITIFFVMLLLILSDLIAPSMLAGPIVKFFIELNPFVILNNVLTKIIILNRPLYEITPMLFKLGVIAFVSAVVAYISKKISEEEVME